MSSHQCSYLATGEYKCGPFVTPTQEAFTNSPVPNSAWGVHEKHSWIGTNTNDKQSTHGAWASIEPFKNASMGMSMSNMYKH